VSWVVVPNLDEAKTQLDARFPNRDKASDGGIGNLAHQKESSSHNPDKTGKPEHRDGDSKDEVRARDFDADLRDPSVNMEQVVQHWVNLARQGKLWWVRYIIYKRRIWHKRDNYVTRNYTGKNTHDKHVHVNSEFTQAADDVRGTNWGLNDINTPAPQPHIREPLVVDGELGPKTIRRWQEVMGTTPDGKIDPKNSQLVRAVQQRLRTVDHTLKVDGHGIAQDGNRYKTVFALQRYLKVPVDGSLSTPKSRTVSALQRRLNENRF
jgi:hypothetical protein